MYRWYVCFLCSPFFLILDVLCICVLFLENYLYTATYIDQFTQQSLHIGDNVKAMWVFFLGGGLLEKLFILFIYELLSLFYLFIWFFLGFVHVVLINNFRERSYLHVPLLCCVPRFFFFFCLLMLGNIWIRPC